MLPAPAQGAIMIVCRENDPSSFESCHLLNEVRTALCTKIERDFLRTLLGGCATPISALAEITEDRVVFKGNILSIDGKEKIETAITKPVTLSEDLGITVGKQLLEMGADKIVTDIRNAGA